MPLPFVYDGNYTINICELDDNTILSILEHHFFDFIDGTTFAEVLHILAKVLDSGPPSTAHSWTSPVDE